MVDVLKLSETTQSHYILIRDFNRGNLFYESTDYNQFICILKNSINQYGCFMHAYALMQDHIHLLITHEHREGINQLINLVQLQYSEYFNFTHRRIERLLDPEHTVEIVNEESRLLPYYRFIELSPVRQGIVAHPSEYPWTSYGSNALGEDIGLITPHRSYLSLGSDDASRWETYRYLFENLPNTLAY